MRAQEGCFAFFEGLRSTNCCISGPPHPPAGEIQALGPACLLGIGGVDVIVVSARSQTFDEAVFQLHGLDVRDFDLVGLKSSAHFRGGFAPIVAEMGGKVGVARFIDSWGCLRHQLTSHALAGTFADLDRGRAGSLD